MQRLAGEGTHVGVTGYRHEVVDQREHGEEREPAERDDDGPPRAEPHVGDGHDQQDEARDHRDRPADLGTEPGPA